MREKSLGENRMKKRHDEGKVFGCYKVIKRVEPKNGKQRYLVKCLNCNTTREIDVYKVTHNNYKYCPNCKPKQKEAESLVGQKFGRLKVLKRVKNRSKKVTWKCQCDCGNICYITSDHLKTGHSKSCGCIQKENISQRMKVDLVGKRFGKLTVLNFDHTDKNGQVWLCQCECGNKCFANTKTLNFKRKQSCGCLTSIAEYELEQYLIKNNYNYKHQYVFKDCKNIRPLPFDFAIFNDQSEIILLIELQGQQHYYPFTFNKEDKETKIMNLKERQRLDDVKRKYCEENRYELLEIKYTDFERKEEIIENKLNELTHKST
jgi:hypothetical protein